MSAPSEEFVPQCNQIVLYQGKPVTALWEICKNVSVRTFKIRIGTIDKSVPMSELSPFVRQKATPNETWKLHRTLKKEAVFIHPNRYN